MKASSFIANEACSAGVEGKVIPLNIAAAKAVAFAVPVLETEQIPLLEAAGRVLADKVRALINLPPFDNSAMDGYAVKTSDFSGTGPWTFTLGGRIAAGDVFEA
jgi:molybdopterin molybdotransferase